MNLRWYIDRSRSMSLPELAHRLREISKRLTWRSYNRGWSAFDIGDGPLPVVPQLGEQLERAVSGSSTLRNRIAKETESLLSGRVSWLNHAWPEGTLADLVQSDPDLFVRDPITGQRWPKVDRYCFEVPYRHSKYTGDVKYVWEINRLQFLQVAAAEARLTKDTVLANKILNLILVWMEANPPFIGINWSSGIELALRIVTIVIVLSFLGEVEDRKIRARLRAFINAHAFWIARYPSLFSSANNHLVAEALGQFIAGSLVPDLPRGPLMAAYGRALLEEEIEKQIFEDGVGAEQSLTYAAFSVELFALAALLGRISGNSFSPAYEQRLASAAESMCWLIDENSHVPAIGDNDEGRSVTLSLGPESSYVASVAAAVGGLLAQNRFVTAPRLPELRDAIFGTPKVAVAPARVGMRIFRKGGYTVVRERHAGEPTLLVFDHGPLGYLSIAAHGHADTLAIWLHVGDVPVFVDGGTFSYHAGGDQRDFLRSTGAHNTVTVENESASIPSGAFNWSHKANARLLSHRDAPNWYVEAEHDGYKSRFGLMHRRRVTHTDHGFDVADCLPGARAPHAVSIRFLLAPNLKFVSDGNAWSVSLPNGLVVSLRGPSGFKAIKATADRSTPAGWISTRFGDYGPADQLLFNGLMGADPVTTQVIIAGKG